MTSEPADLARRYTRLLTLNTLAVVLAIGLVLVGLSFLPIPSTAVTLAIGSVGSGVVASVVVYAIVSLRLDPIRQAEQTNRIISQVNDIWYQQFNQRFQEWLPTHTYTGSEVLRRDLREEFARLVKSSDRYDYKGGTANYTTFRLFTLARHPDIRRLHEIRLCLLDPRQMTPLKAFGVQQLQQRRITATDDEIEAITARIKNDIYISIVALFDIRHAVSTAIYFHGDLPVSRCEMFDDGMFLTYYQADVKYPPVFQFAANTSSFRTYKQNMDLTREFAAKVLRFDRTGPSADLVHTAELLQQRLTDLGCRESVATLREQMEARFVALRRELEVVHMDPKELF